MESTNSGFECCICMESPKKPVVTPCGHMYCWKCIRDWLTQNTHTLRCPVCKSGISQEKLIPIYSKENDSDPREQKDSEEPERPKARWEEPTRNPNYSRFRNFREEAGGVNFQAGVGLFPGIFGVTFTMNSNDPRADIMSKIMLVIGVIIFLSVIF